MAYHTLQMPAVPHCRFQDMTRGVRTLFLESDMKILLVIQTSSIMTIIKREKY